MALNLRSLRWFEACACTPTSRGLPSSPAKHRCHDKVMASFVAHDLLVLDSPPEPLDENVVEDPPFAVHADGDAVGLQNVGKILACELRSLVGVEDLRDAEGKSLFEGLHAKGGVEGKGYLPGEHVPAVPVHDCREVDEAFPHGDVGDVGTEDMVGLCDV